MSVLLTGAKRENKIETKEKGEKGGPVPNYVLFMLGLLRYGQASEEG